MYANQAEYDNAVEPGYWDEDDSCVYEVLQDEFNTEFTTIFQESSATEIDTINDLLFKLASGFYVDTDVDTLKTTLQGFYSSELDKYNLRNYNEVYDRLKDNT